MREALGGFKVPGIHPCSSGLAKFVFCSSGAGVMRGSGGLVAGSQPCAEV